MTRDIAAERADIDATIAGKTLCTVFRDTANKHGDVTALRWQRADGEWAELSWRGYRHAVRDAALGLRSLGFAPGEFGIIMARNRAEHVIADQGIVHAGGTPVTLYNTLAPEQIAYQANHCGATIAILEDASFVEKVLSIREQLPDLRTIVVMDDDGVDAGVTRWDELLATGNAEATRSPDLFEQLTDAVKPDDLLTIIYTSGTTGPPKGVMDLHRNVLWTIESFRRMHEAAPGTSVISYLPLAHAAERFTSLWNAISRGLTATFCPDLTQLLAVLLAARPELFVGVPRVWEKLYAGINAAITGEPDATRAAMIEKAVAVGRQRVRLEQRGEPIPEDLAEQWTALAPVAQAILARVGLDGCVSSLTGAAPISTEVIEFFHALGLRVSEVWGMSELTAPATWNGTERIKIGSVGVAMPGVEVRLGDDREVLVRGGLTMAGYFASPEQTAEAIDDEGWMHTGDVATVDDEGYYTIVDRIKELIITAGGKNISPANLEGLLKQHPLIGQACVIGDRRPFLVALLALDPEVAPVWARARGIEAGSPAVLAEDPQVRAQIERAVATVNERVAKVEQIKRFEILPVEWTAESEELTPTLKLKRRVINDKYADVIESLY